MATKKKSTKKKKAPAKKKAACCGKCKTDPIKNVNGANNDPINDPTDIAGLNDPFNRLILAVGDIGWQCAVPKDGWASKPGEIGGLVIGTEEYVSRVMHCIEVTESQEAPVKSFFGRMQDRIKNLFYGW